MRKLFPVHLVILAAISVSWAALSPVQEEPLPSGAWDLATDGVRLTIRTREADLGEVLRGLQALMPSSPRFGSVPATNITVRFQHIELDQLLQRLGVSYVLTYTQGDGRGDPTLRGAWVGYFEPGEQADSLPAFRERPRSTDGGTVSDGLWAKVGLHPPDVPDPKTGVIVRSPYPVSVGLDGDLGDWPEDTPWQFITHGMGGANRAANDADASFAVASAADEKNLFLAVHVNDDRKATKELDANAWMEDDAVRLIIDNLDAADPDGRMAELNMIVKRHHVLQRDPDNPEILRAAPVQYVRNSRGASVVIRDGEDGWTVEASIDFESLGIDPEAQTDLGFNVRLVDYDEGEENPHRLTWSRAERLDASETSGESDLGRIQLAR